MKEAALLKFLSKNNKGKSKVKIGDRREDYAKLSDMVFEQTQGINDETGELNLAIIPAPFYIEMWNNGKRRHAKIKAAEEKARLREEAKQAKIKERERLKLEKAKAKLEAQEQALNEGGDNATT